MLAAGRWRLLLHLEKHEDANAERYDLLRLWGAHQFSWYANDVDGDVVVAYLDTAPSRLP